ncbi:RpsU3 [Vibrio phage 2.275.O._10N.286.54.E11]|nr:RpsU3 [Vibrio phage 2.275.O._10N.286.54.E11]
MAFNKILKGTSVQPRSESDKDFDHALRKFKRNMKESGLIEEVRERQHYTSKGEKRREAKKAAKRRTKRSLIKEQELRKPKF